MVDSNCIILCASLDCLDGEGWLIQSATCRHYWFLCAIEFSFICFKERRENPTFSPPKSIKLVRTFFFYSWKNLLPWVLLGITEFGQLTIVCLHLRHRAGIFTKSIIRTSVFPMSQTSKTSRNLLNSQTH